MEFFEGKDSEAEVRRHIVAMTGAGAADPVKNYGQGVTVTRVALGRYKITWAENPGIFVGPLSKSIDAHTPANVKGWTAVFGDYDKVNFAIEVDTFDSTFAAVELAAQEYLTVTLGFKAISV